jgi:dsDNA-specific endonuclease/ATPase MutS2
MDKKFKIGDKVISSGEKGEVVELYDDDLYGVRLDYTDFPPVFVRAECELTMDETKNG